jgi:hypothetical protein
MTAVVGPPGVLVGIKHDLGFTDGDLARATGAGVRTIRRLTSPNAPRRSRHAERIDDLRTIVEVVREAYSAEATRSWLLGRNRLLAFDRPIDRIAAGDFAEVLGAAQAFVDGDYV